MQRASGAASPYPAKNILLVIEVVQHAIHDHDIVLVIFEDRRTGRSLSYVHPYALCPGETLDLLTGDGTGVDTVHLVTELGQPNRVGAFTCADIQCPAWPPSSRRTEDVSVEDGVVRGVETVAVAFAPPVSAMSAVLSVEEPAHFGLDRVHSDHSLASP